MVKVKDVTQCYLPGPLNCSVVARSLTIWNLISLQLVPHLKTLFLLRPVKLYMQALEASDLLIMALVLYNNHNNLLFHKCYSPDYLSYQQIYRVCWVNYHSNTPRWKSQISSCQFKTSYYFKLHFLFIFLARQEFSHPIQKM